VVVTTKLGFLSSKFGEPCQLVECLRAADRRAGREQQGQHKQACVSKSSCAAYPNRREMYRHADERRAIAQAGSGVPPYMRRHSNGANHEPDRKKSTPS